MRCALPIPGALVVLLAASAALNARTAATNAADGPMHQFLAQDDRQPSYRALRRLEAENGGRTGWIEATTEYFDESGFHYEVTAEGGSNYIRNKVLRAVLDAERDTIARGETARFSLDRTNYLFEPGGIDTQGLAKVHLTPLREDRVLVAGEMFLQPSAGDLVRLQGRLAKNPSFWIKNVDIVRSYERIGGIVVPVALESTAQIRLFGAASLRMIYSYSEIDGHPVAAP